MRRLATVGLMLTLVLGTTPANARDAGVDRAEGVFEPAGKTKGDREHLASATLPDGRVLVVGLYGVMSGPFWEPVPAELWDPASGTFSDTGTPLQNRAQTAAVALDDGRVLLVGGTCIVRGTDRLVRFAELWDPETGRFAKAGRLKEPRYWHDAALLPDGRVVVVGGSGAKKTRATIETWDPETSKFRRAGKLPEPRFGQTTTVLPDGRVLIVGGFTERKGGWDPRRGDRYLKEALAWDPATGKVSAAGKLNTARSDHAAALLPDGRVLIVGGDHWVRGEFASAEVWDPETEAFNETGSMSVPRSGHSATTLPDGRVLIVGGAGISAEVWDPVTDSFRLSGPMLQSRSSHVANLLPDGRVLIVGGEDAGTEAELWDPTKTFAPAPPATLALGSCAASDDPEATALAAQFPATLREAQVEVASCRGAEWLAMHDASEAASAATLERSRALLESVRSTTDDMTVATARVEPAPGDSTTITALRVTGAQASRLKELAVPLLLGIERPQWSGDYVGPNLWVSNVRDEAVPGSEPWWVYAPMGDTLWLIGGAERKLLADIIEALPGPGGRLEVPELGVAVTFPRDWSVDVGLDPLEPAWDHGSETLAWQIASGMAPLDEDDQFPENCGLSLYRPTQLPVDEVMWRLTPEGDFAQPGPLEDGLYGYVGPYKLFDADIDMAMYGVASGNAVAVLLCLGKQAPADQWRSIVDSIELSPVDEDRWRFLLESAEASWLEEELPVETVEPTPEPTP